MKKKNIINLIRAYSEKNDLAFRNEAISIAKIFFANGDRQLAEYIMTLMTNVDSFIPQNYEGDLKFLNKIELSNQNSLPLPKTIYSDILGLINAVNKNMGINKFIFYGAPGTGKTETVKQIARILKRDLYSVDIPSIVDSKLGQTSKNISELFEEIKSFAVPQNVIILFDEIDSLVMDRINDLDVREMGRATSTFLTKMDEMNSKIILIATTNLMKKMDKAILRRFDYSIDFSRYSREDLIEIAVMTLDNYLKYNEDIVKDKRLFMKIMNCFNEIPFPAELVSMIKSAIAFSDPNDNSDYLKRLLKNAIGHNYSYEELIERGFTLREVESLTSISKSKLSRLMKDGD